MNESTPNALARLSILAAMREHKVEDAFLELLPLLSEEWARVLFVELLRKGQDMFLLVDHVDRMKTEAEAGNPYMQYAYARYHDACQPDPKSNEIMEHYYEKADAAGIADAHMCMAYCWRDGDFGLIDRERYFRMRNEAIDNGSHMAMQQQLQDLAYGEAGYTRDPWKAYDALDKFIRQSDERNERYDPKYLRVLAGICEEIGRNAEADMLYEKAFKGGDMMAWYWLMRLRCNNKEGQLENLELYEKMCDEVQDLAIAEAYTSRQLATEVYWDLDPDDEELRADLSSLLKDCLDLGYTLGDRTAPFFMGYNYYEGQYGFEQDYASAWQWFARSALMRCNMGYTMMARMLEDGQAPEGYNEEFQHVCELRALRLGDDDMLDKVVEAYKHGFLTDYAAEIERYHLPEYESKHEEDDYEPDEGDDGRYDAWS